MNARMSPDTRRRLLSLVSFLIVAGAAKWPVAAAAQDSWTATGAAGAPTARSVHTAVWTGSKMIVWGGYRSGAGTLGDGGMYDLAAGAWAAVSTAGATARDNHTAVWTGTKMIVWGGFRTSALGDGGAYSPAANTWTAVSMAGAPAARVAHTAVWTGTRMIVWGGEVQTGSGYFADGGLYDPATDTWAAVATAGAPTARAEHAAVWTGSKMIVWGGSGGAAYRGDGGVYDPATNAWTAVTTAGAPAARRRATAVWTGSKMIVWGGYNGTYRADGGVYDPATNAWSAMATAGAPASREGHTAVWTGSKMVVWGGYNGTYRADGGVYDPATNTWTAMASTGAPSSRTLHTAVWTGSKMIVWGGSRTPVSLADGGIYEPPTTPKVLFTGIFGRSAFELYDNPRRHITSWVDDEIPLYAAAYDPACSADSCDPRDLADLEAIAATEAGGITSLALHATSFPGHASLNMPGNSEVLKTDISTQYRDGDHVYIVGHSAGGGDTQNLLEKLDALGIPVETSGHIDSIEVGDDATIPPNTRLAQGFYQTGVMSGENHLVAVDPYRTTVTNTRIVDPVGPFTSRLRGRGHRNMDNDPRVWGPLLDAVDETAAAQVSEAPGAEPELPADLQGLVRALQEERAAEEKRRIRQRLAALEPRRDTFEFLIALHQGSDDPALEDQVCDVLAHLDPGDFVPRVEALARSTNDLPLFVSLAYALRRAGTVPAKQALVALTDARANASEPATVLTAVHLAFSPIVHPDDAPWLLAMARHRSLTRSQIELLARSARRIRPRDAAELLRALLAQTRDDDLRRLLRRQRSELRRQIGFEGPLAWAQEHAREGW